MSKRPWTYEQHAAAHAYFRNLQQEKTKLLTKLEALRDTVSINCNPPDDCNDPVVLKTYMKACFDEAEKLYD